MDKRDELGHLGSYGSAWAPLHHVARSGALEMVELLLRLGANVNIVVLVIVPHHGQTSLMAPLEIILMYCEEDISVQVLRSLVEGGSNINHMD